jgi:hypothetical protein
MNSELKDSLRVLNSVVGLVPLPALKPIIGLIQVVIAAASTPVQWDDIKAWINNLKSEATIVRTFYALSRFSWKIVHQATFLAAVQAQIIAISYTNNSSPTSVATNAFGFMGIMFDVIAALLALLSSTVMQTRVSVIDRILSNTAKLNNDQLAAFLGSMLNGSGRHTRFVRAMLLDIIQPLMKRLVVAGRQIAGGENENLSGIDADDFDPNTNGSQVVKYCSEIDSIRVLGDAAGASMLFGILSFMASIVCLAIATQPVTVWACMVMACSCVFFLPLVNRGLAYFGLRKQVSL